MTNHGYKIGDKVKVLDATRILGGSAHFRNGDVTEIIGFSSVGSPKLKTDETRSQGIVILGAELQYIELYDANKERAGVIKMAQEFVKAHREGDDEGCLTRFRYVNDNPRKVIAEARGIRTHIVWNTAESVCAPDDVYNRDIGEAIALSRLRGIETPEAFLKAPQPTKLVKGMVIEMSNGKSIKLINPDPNPLADTEKLLEDTDAVYDPLATPAKEPKKFVAEAHSKTLDEVAKLPEITFLEMANGLEKAEDNPIRPDHYHHGGIDVFAYGEANFSKEAVAGFYRMNIIKYVTRYDKKNGMQDLEKAESYLNSLMKLERGSDD